MSAQLEVKQVIKIEIAGTVTSFRYPHFTQGVHPTLEMPPPSTIYGHICAVVGDWIDPEILQFAYCFTHSGKFVDYKEHLHFSNPIQPFPFDRELLFEPRLTLYVIPIDLFEAFRRPHFAVTLGRSQDLMTYTSLTIETLQKLQPGEVAYLEHTILPLEMAPRVGGETIAVTMASYLNPRRQPIWNDQSTWNTYALLRDSVIFPPPKREPTKYDEDEVTGFVMEGDEERFELWVDPETPPHRKFPEARRALWFHRFVG